MSDPHPGTPPHVQAGRLDSWKAIAEYLGRDIRTVMRWETERQLPIRRVPGGRGRTVFAIRSEIDAWLSTAPSEVRVLPTAPSGAADHRGNWFQRRAFALTVVAALAGSSAWWWWSARIDTQNVIVRAEADARGLTAWNADGKRAWFRAFPAEPRLMLTPEPAAVVSDLEGDGRQSILVGVAEAMTASHVDQGGELLAFSAKGESKWRFVANEHLQVGARAFAGPWPLATWMAPSDGPFRIALAVHDLTWWPSIVYVLDSHGGVAGRFVNAGWIGMLAWIESPDGARLIAGGISNSQSSGIVAVLDASRISGQSPEKAGSEFECHNCPTGGPLAYFVFPRTELNQATGSSFNRARVFASPGGLTVRTEEVSPEVAGGDGGVEVIYQFTSNFELASVSFGDRYWDLHRRLERDGRIRHTSDQCPDRKGPREIRVWQPPSGWRTAVSSRR